VNFTRRNNPGHGGGQGGGQGGQSGHPPGGRGNGDGGRGRGQGRGIGGRGQTNQACGNGNGAPRPVCQICNKIGHIALRCYSRFDHAYGGDDEHYSANHAASTSYQVDPNWYTDSGATDHITGNLDRLHMREAYHGNDRVQVGNGAGLRISHTGYSTINTAAKSHVLKNVLHVPNISKNLLSVHKLARDNGVFLDFHPYYFLIKDLVSRKTLLHGRCRGGLYPIE
jgi:histone deacetylase 1/2